MAMLLLLSVFLVQFTSNQIIHEKLLFAQKDIEEALQTVKRDGCFTPENKAELLEKLKKDIRPADEAAIIIRGSDIPVRRGERIEYSVTIPIDNIVAANRFLGISDSENRADKEYKGYVTSEWTG